MAHAGVFSPTPGGSGLRRYNIVLLPIIDAQSGFIALSRERFAGVAHTYLLHPESSLPHVSVFQIATDISPKTLEGYFWELLLSLKAKLPISIEFEAEINLREGHGKFVDVNWIQLVPTKESSIILQEIHEVVLAALRARGLEPQNSHGHEYHPHLTLCNILKSKPVILGDGLDAKITASFDLALGDADESGQFLRVRADKDCILEGLKL